MFDIVLWSMTAFLAFISKVSRLLKELLISLVLLFIFNIAIYYVITFHILPFDYRYSMPPHFDLDGGLDDSYDDSESTRDTVRQIPLSHHHPQGGHQSRGHGKDRPTSRYDDRDSRTPNQGSNSQASGRA